MNKALDLVKKHRLFIYGYSPFWVVSSKEPGEPGVSSGAIMTDNENLDIAIFECVKKIEKKNEQLRT